MARPLRIEYAGALYHVTSRGNRRAPVFKDDQDRRDFVVLLAAVVGRFRWLCHAYCLMGNHYHLLVETPEPNLSRGMRQLNGVYTQRHNARHARVGHVFQGRYKAIVVEKESHLLEVCRYVVLNPVRAGMVERAEAWPWSSYRATAGLRGRPEFLTTDWVLQQFGRERLEAQKEYRRFVGEGIGRPWAWEGLVGGVLLGTREFVAQFRERLREATKLKEVPRRERYSARATLEELFSASAADRAGRNQAIRRAYLEHGYRMNEIADFLRIHYATVSRVLNSSRI